MEKFELSIELGKESYQALQVAAGQEGIELSEYAIKVICERLMQDGFLKRGYPLAKPTAIDD
jgi:hypothetical protein